MKYIRYRLSFPNGVHFGKKDLIDSNITFSADTLFSALYIEALHQGKEKAKKLYEAVKQNELLLTDAFPYVDDVNYIPKPLKRVEYGEENGDSVIKKAWKNLSYIPMDEIENYFQGNLNPRKEKLRLDQLGKSILRASAAVRTGGDAEPYYVGEYVFSKSAGLFFIVCISEELQEFFYDLLDALSFSGLGGKRSAGLGRFEIKKMEEMSEKLFCSKEECSCMALSVSLPKEREMEKVLEGASYQIVKRSGFVYSETYALELRKKKDLYVFQSGSCFETTFEGDVYDVSANGAHAVYRYAKPVFIKI